MSVRAARFRAGMLALAATLLVGSRSDAQVLELGGVTAPPALDRPTYAQTLAGELETEIADRIMREPEASPLERLVLRASVNLRVIAADLLATGDEAEGAGSQAILAALTLVAGRQGIDALLQQLADRTAADADEQAELFAAREALRQFNDDAVRLAASISSGDPERLDRALPAILSSLADAVATLGGVDAISHWPSIDSVRPGGGVERPSAPEDSVRLLRERLDVSTLPEPTRQLVAEIVGYLERAEPFADLRAMAESYRPLIGGVFRFEDALVAASWLGPEVVASQEQRLHRALVLFRDPATRARGERRLAVLERSGHVIGRITGISANPRVDAAPVQEAFLAADALAAQLAETEPSGGQLDTLARIVDRMIRFRDLEPLPAGQRLAVVYRQLERRYRESEAALLEQLMTITSDDDAVADPAFASLLNDHRQSLDDLRRVQLVPGWIDSATLIHPPSGRRFQSTARQWCERLPDPGRRPEVILAMTAFERELAAYFPLPFERELRAGSGVAVQATGGFNEPFMVELDDRRREWVEGWARGEVDAPAEQAMRLVHGLLQLMSDTAAVFRLGGETTSLNPWAGWELPAGSLTRVLSELPSRLKLAVAATIDDEDEALARQLDQISQSAPLAQLLGRLVHRLEPVLVDLPPGATSTMGQLLFPPTPSAWLFPERAALANLCRYSLEETHARRLGKLDLAQRLAGYINGTAERALETIEATEASNARGPAEGSR